MPNETVTASKMTERLRGATTKRELDLLVDYLRRPGRYPQEQRDELERLAQAEAQKFSVAGEHVRAGRYSPGFRNVVRERA